MSLQQHELRPEAHPPRRPRNRVGQGARKVPRQLPLKVLRRHDDVLNWKLRWFNKDARRIRQGEVRVELETRAPWEARSRRDGRSDPDGMRWLFAKCRGRAG